MNIPVAVTVFGGTNEIASTNSVSLSKLRNTSHLVSTISPGFILTQNAKDLVAIATVSLDFTPKETATKTFTVKI